MIEVLKIYNQREETIYRAFFLLDLFLLKSESPLSVNNLHLVGTACLMLASKHEEVAFIHTDTIIKNIAYGKFTLEELL